MKQKPAQITSVRSRCLGIGGRLISAFLVVAGMTAAAGTASSWFALQGSTIVSGLGSHSLPTVSESLTFAQRSAVLAAAAPALALQKDAAALDGEAGKLAALMAEQKVRLASLRQLSASPAILDDIERMGAGLGDRIGTLKTLTAERLAASTRLERGVADTLGAFQDLNDFSRPLVEATQGDVDHLLADLRTGDPAQVAATTASLTGTAMPALRALTEIQANGNLVNGMLAAAANAPSDEAFNDLRTQYNWGELYLNKAVKALGSGADGERFAKLSAALLSAGSGKEGIFALHDARTALDGRIAAALSDMVAISNGLAAKVGDLVDQERAAAAAAVAASATTTWRSLLVNAVLGGLVVVTCGLIGWLYVGRIVIRRLDRLARAMGRLADGDRSVSVDTRGDDEISAMADAVHVFKANMIRGDGLAAEAERHAAERETVRARAEEERAATAREQARVVDALAEGLSRLAKGDLTHELRDPFANAYEGLRADFNAAVAQLKAVMQQVVANASAIRNGTGEISSAADDLSRRTEQQAANLEETAAALGEITATVRQAAEGAKQARDAVGTAKADAEQSGLVVGRAVEAMSGIEDSSSRIGRIVGVIDEIAFQTNLLALNAGVEAARAGDAGRGFAVVASEVRALAQRSADAAKEIKGLISTSNHHVEQGVDLVRRTGEALQRIVLQVARIDGIVQDIAASAQDQAASLGEVNTAVNQMDRVTQQNAALMEESTAASHTLAREAEGLSDLTGRFMVGQDNRVVTPLRRPAARGRSGRTATAMKPLERGGAAREPATAEEAWEEF